MPKFNDQELANELKILFVKYEIERAFMAVPQPDDETYSLFPYQMGNNMVRHLAASLLQNIPAVENPTLN